MQTTKRALPWRDLPEKHHNTIRAVCFIAFAVGLVVGLSIGTIVWI